MDSYSPSYCRSFRCLADRCKANCCIGWEIGIDPDTAALYRSAQGDFGDRLRANISDDNCFILQNDRCPFLNEQNLCDILLHCGETALCDICRMHPRYFNWFSDRKEGGIGLSCEEAARLILTTDRVGYIREETDDAPEEADEQKLSLLLRVREQMFSLLDDDSLALQPKLCGILTLAEKTQQQICGRQTPLPSDGKKQAQQILSQLLSCYEDFEPIDRVWTQQLALLKCRPLQGTPPTQAQSLYCTNLCRYFLWRYFLCSVFDDEVYAAAAFAVVSSLFIHLLCADDTSLACCIEKSRLYSAQMEYSDENTAAFFGLCSETDCLQPTALCTLLQKVFP